MNAFEHLRARHAEEPAKQASRSTHDRGACFETQPAAAPQHDAVGSFNRKVERAASCSALIAAVLLCFTAPTLAQTCNYVPKPIADDAMRFLTEGRETQYYCAPCHDRRAVRTVVAEAEIRQLDTYNHQVLINGRPTDLAYLYLFDPGRKRWRNLGLALRCHEEDDVPPTLPANRFAP